MTSSKARRDENTFVAEGVHLVQSFLAAKKTPLLYVYAESAPQNQEIKQLIQELEAMNIPCATLSDSLFESLATIHATSGIVILFTPEKHDETLLPPTENVVLLEDIQDPGNLGTILRTAVAAGIKHALLSAGCASPWSPKALRAGMGAQFSLVINERADLLDTVKKAKIPVLATTLSEDSTSLYTLDLHRPVSWVFGSEGQGVSQDLASAATHRVHIPQVNSSVESLNVAAAAAVCMYEQYRQNSV